MSPQVLQLGVWGQDRGSRACAVLFGAAEGLKSTGCSCSTASPKSSQMELVQMFGKGGGCSTSSLVPPRFWVGTAGEPHILSGGYSPSPSVFLSPFPTLFPAAESWEEREVPLGDEDQAGIPEQ